MDLDKFFIVLSLLIHIDSTEKKLKNSQKMQRGLILQGGGTLGAYEAGVFRGLYEQQTKANKETGIEGQPLFDIVAGTSIGAINGAILVSHVKENGTWEGSDKRLIEFWDDISKRIGSSFDWTSQWYKFLNPWNRNNEDEFRKILKKILPQYIKFPLKTNYKDGEPRLLVVSVDMLEGESVVFDSYPKKEKDDCRRTEYGEIVHAENDWQHKYVIDYDGITLEHILASSAVPIYSSPVSIPVRKVGSGLEEHYFWDGALLSNTPIEEFIQSYKQFWPINGYYTPDIDMYIVNILSSKDNSQILPRNFDEKIGRMNSILFSDRTSFEQNIITQNTDYLNLINTLIILAKKNGSAEDELQKILEHVTQSQFKTGDKMTYGDLLVRNPHTHITKISRGANTKVMGWSELANLDAHKIRALIDEGYADCQKSLI